MSDNAPPTGKYAYSLSLLTTIYVFNFVDRQVINIVAEPIKRELHLADWQVGVMSGIAFAILYTVLGFPVARMAERGDRAKIIGVAIVVWSAFTVACGFAQSFAQLALARVGVGVGEAGGSPPAHSLIAEIVPRARRASALAIYAMGVPAGQVIGVGIGGLVADQWGWRYAFFVAGAPGLALALLAVTTLDEPRRRARKQTLPLPPFWKTIRALAANRSFVLVACGAAALSLISYGHAAFVASFFLRNHGVELAATAADFGLKPIGFLGLTLGISGGLAGVAGAILGGPLADRWAARDIAGYAALPAICVGLTVPVLSGALLSPMGLAIPLFAAAAFLNAVAFGPIFASVQGLVPPWSRATASAGLLFVINIIGLALGPTLIGLFSDIFATRLGLGEGDGLRWAMIAATASGIVAMLLFNAARQTIRRDTVS